MCDSSEGVSLSLEDSVSQRIEDTQIAKVVSGLQETSMTPPYD